MSGMSWFRMYAEFATDPKVQMLSEADQRRYLMLLCLRCSNGSVTLHDSEVAFQLRVSDEEWQKTKALLIEKNLITEDNKPTQWDKRQYASDSSKSRVAKHRAKRKKEVKQECNVTVTPPDTDTDTDTDNKNNDFLEKKFEKFWEVARENWVGPVGAKKEAKLEFLKIKPTDMLLAKMIKTIKTKSQLDKNRQNIPDEFVGNWKHAVRWLKYECWESESPGNDWEEQQEKITRGAI